jgi:hypothetical protein
MTNNYIYLFYDKLFYFLPLRRMLAEQGAQYHFPCKKYAFFYKQTELQSRLPETVKTAENGEAFRRRLKGKPE